MRSRRPVARGISWRRVCRTRERRLRWWRQRSARNTVWVTIQRTKRATENIALSELRCRAHRRSRRFEREKDTLLRRVRSRYERGQSIFHLSFDISHLSLKNRFL